ncbi:MAG: hypothetical protein LUC97_09320 [Clostridiales bacterium]|nr:hypothetical protein [Clostridiales bacterium]
MEGKEKFLKSEAYKGLDEAKKQLIKNFLETEKPDINDIVFFIGKINKESPLTENQQKQLFEALSESLSEADKR